VHAAIGAPVTLPRGELTPGRSLVPGYVDRTFPQKGADRRPSLWIDGQLAWGESVAGSYFEVDTPPSVPDDPSYSKRTRHWGIVPAYFREKSNG